MAFPSCIAQQKRKKRETGEVKFRFFIRNNNKTLNYNNELASP